MSSGSSSGDSEPDAPAGTGVHGAPAGPGVHGAPDAAARLAGLAVGAEPLIPLLGVFEDSAVAVCFAGADVEQLQHAYERLAARPAWALVVLAPGAAPWIACARGCCAHAISKSLELLAEMAPATHKRHCVAGAVRMLAEIENLGIEATESALALADILVAQGAHAARRTVVIEFGQGGPVPHHIDSLAAGVVLAAEMVSDGVARMALVAGAAEGVTAMAITAAPDVPEAEIRELVREVTGHELPGNGIARHPPPV